jgi:hypothetical protein
MTKTFDPFVTTVSGKRFHILDPLQESIDIEDIAHSLSMISRWNGHTVNGPYSVAEHCVYVSYLVCNDTLALYALLHDAGEAYTSDIPTPVKKCSQEFMDIERQIQKEIFRKFAGWNEWDDYNLIDDHVIPPDVQRADAIALASEHRDLRNPDAGGWIPLEKPDPRPVVPLYDWRKAKKLFLDRFYEITERLESAKGSQ